MKTRLLLLLVVILSVYNISRAQDYQISTVLGGGDFRASGGYGALINKFTTIDGKFVNMAGIYGGWYINHKFLLGIGAAAMTNNMPVPEQYRVNPDLNTSYEYGQFGLMTEYVVASHRAVHVGFQLFSGAGFTVQYERYGWQNHDYSRNYEDDNKDENFFFVAEPGVNVEVNIFKWMRFCPGISYRAAFGSQTKGLSDNSLSNATVNLGLKFGKF